MEAGIRQWHEYLYYSHGLSKAFDISPHVLLRAKLETYNVSDQGCEMIKSYLHMTSQKVKLSMHKSGWKWLEEGTPQTSINDPDLFSIFLNDLLCCLEGLCNIDNYAGSNIMA